MSLGLLLSGVGGLLLMLCSGLGDVVLLAEEAPPPPSFSRRRRRIASMVSLSGASGVGAGAGAGGGAAGCCCSSFGSILLFRCYNCNGCPRRPKCGDGRRCLVRVCGKRGSGIGQSLSTRVLTFRGLKFRLSKPKQTNGLSEAELDRRANLCRGAE